MHRLAVEVALRSQGQLISALVECLEDGVRQIKAAENEPSELMTIDSRSV